VGRYAHDPNLYLVSVPGQSALKTISLESLKEAASQDDVEGRRVYGALLKEALSLASPAVL
jgi:hypothetical protein